jgi:drug/metabolite transporter (DMT)-like permease
LFELWVPITIAAAFFQNARSALQKHLKARLSTAGAPFVRFSYGFPIAILYVIFLNQFADLPVPEPNLRFALFCVFGGVAQILATALLVYLFSFRNFAVGSTYSKTETVQAALFGLIILGDAISLPGLIAIIVSLIGVLMISVARSTITTRNLLLSWTEKPALIGLASGAAFGISAVAYRAASLALPDVGFVMRAGFTLACVTGLQTLLMTGYIGVREPGQLTQVLKAWRVAALVGLCGITASACWFSAMTIQKVAYVRALGQIELVFTFLASYLFFKERINRFEFFGIVLIIGGILFLLFAR